jgi:hypothetical protein
MTRASALVAVALLCRAPIASAQIAESDAASRSRLWAGAFDLQSTCEVTAVVRASCEDCSWGADGREGAALRIGVDGRYSQHLMLSRGDARSDYHVSLGAFEAGRHTFRIDLDPTLSAPHAESVSVASVNIEWFAEKSVRWPSSSQMETRGFTALSHAPILHARANTIGRFTDLPILMWYEVVPTMHGRQFRYSVIFTNEDGGTPTDRLMATWGRTTDIEFVYGVEIDEKNEVIAEEFQGPGHQVPKFTGQHEGRHPLLWVATDNNMVSDHGTTTMRYRLVPEYFDLTDKSREAVMDAHPWSYTLAAQELAREGKIAENPAPGSGKIPDPRRYVFVEACSELTNAALAFSIRAKDAGGTEAWFDSDRGLAEFRIVRAGCFRGGVPLPAGSGPPEAIRFHAVPRAAAADPSALPSVTVTRINKVFTLAADYTPNVSSFEWVGWLELPTTGEWRELSFAIAR